MDGVIIGDLKYDGDFYFVINSKGWCFGEEYFTSLSDVRGQKERCICNGWPIGSEPFDLSCLIPTKMIENG